MYTANFWDYGDKYKYMSGVEKLIKFLMYEILNENSPCYSLDFQRKVFYSCLYTVAKTHETSI